MGKKPANTNVRFWRDPDLAGVEVRFSSYNEEAFRKHTHDAYSIGLIHSGRTTFYLEGENHSTRTGQIALIPPGAVHACNPDQDTTWSYRMFYVQSFWLEEVAAELTGQDALKPVFPSPVVDDPPLYDAWEELYQAIEQGVDKLEKQSRLVECLAMLLTHHADLAPPQEEQENPQAVDMVRSYLARHLDAKVTLKDLSDLTGVSRYHLLRIFQERTGLPPHAFHNQLRVDRSKALLARGEPLSQVAFEAGFVDQSHFTRVFKKYTGATPLQYQDGHRPPQ